MTADLERMSAIFARFGERECRTHSPLYASLSLKIANDPDLLGIAARGRPGQPPPNLLFAAAHYLLLGKESGDPLAAFYPDLTPDPGPIVEAWPHYRRFCLAHEAAIIGLVANRTVATNEIARCSVLRPAFLRVLREAGATTVQFVEVGASAGFNLLWDRLAYDYGDGRTRGAEGAPLTLVCELRGPGCPDWTLGAATVGQKIGIDLEPRLTDDGEAIRWLRALIWPEERPRYGRLDAALDLAGRFPPRLIAGDGVVLLPRIVDALPGDDAVCVFHAFTLNQFPDDARRAFDRVLRDIGRSRDCWRVSLEWSSVGAAILGLTRYGRGKPEAADLALCDAHGGWFEWRDG